PTISASSTEALKLLAWKRGALVRLAERVGVALPENNDTSFDPCVAAGITVSLPNAATTAAAGSSSGVTGEDLYDPADFLVLNPSSSRRVRAAAIIMAHTNSQQQ